MTPHEWADKHLTIAYIGDMHWRGKPPRTGSDTHPTQVWARDLVAASERHRAAQGRKQR